MFFYCVPSTRQSHAEEAALVVKEEGVLAALVRLCRVGEDGAAEDDVEAARMQGRRRAVDGEQHLWLVGGACRRLWRLIDAFRSEAHRALSLFSLRC